MSITLEKQLDELAACGIHLLPEITINNLLESYERQKYEAEPFTLLLGVMVQRAGSGTIYLSV